MIPITINGIDIEFEEGSTILEATNFLGINIPTLCYHEGLSSYGACRLCVVEVGKGDNTRLVTSCNYQIHRGLEVKTHSEKVMKNRRMLIEMMLATVPGSKTVQDLASKHGVTEVRFEVEHNDCLLCGLCVRICKEQMNGEAVNFINRGKHRKITTAFDMKSERCRLCGACMYICPACQSRCQGWNSEEPICNSCLNLEPPCIDINPEAMCYLDPCAACELPNPKRQSKGE
jgi:NADH dehydrogenase/NADH:ubiquinone oxidoreductase subunit G